MPLQLRSELTSCPAAGLSANTTTLARSESIAETIVQFSAARDWERLGSFLAQLEEVSQTRGAILMRALNVPAPRRVHTVLPYLINHGAPAELISRVIALGAL